MKSVLSTEFLRKTALIVVLLWIIAQVIVIIVFERIPQISDAEVYRSLALKCAKTGHWYPTSEQLTAFTKPASFIYYPGLINLYILLIRVFGTTTAIFWNNLLLNIGFGLSVWKIAETLSGRRIAYITLILFCISHVNILFPAMSLSEVPAHAFGFGAIALFCCNRKWLSILSGISISFAIYIRPSMALLGIALIVYLFVNRNKIKRLLLPAGAFIAMTGLLILFNYHNSGFIFYTSNTAGINMHIGANDNSYRTGSGNLSDTLVPTLNAKNVFQCDSLHKAESLKWISKNKKSWIKTGFKKLNNQIQFNSYYIMSRSIYDNPLYHSGNPFARLLTVFWLRFFQIYEILLYALFIIGILESRKKIRHRWWPILLPIAGVMTMAFLTVGGHRYNLPNMPIIMFFAAIAINRITFRAKYGFLNQSPLRSLKK